MTMSPRRVSTTARTTVSFVYTINHAYRAENKNIYVITNILSHPRYSVYVYIYTVQTSRTIHAITKMAFTTCTRVSSYLKFTRARVCYTSPWDAHVINARIYNTYS